MFIPDIDRVAADDSQVQRGLTANLNSPSDYPSNSPSNCPSSYPSDYPSGYPSNQRGTLVPHHLLHSGPILPNAVKDLQLLPGNSKIETLPKSRSTDREVVVDPGWSLASCVTQMLQNLENPLNLRVADHTSTTLGPTGVYYRSKSISRLTGGHVGSHARSFGGSALLLSLLAFAYGGLCIYSAKRDVALAKIEATASGQAYLHPQGRNPNFLDALRCDYQFTVNNRPYTGHGRCPAQTDHSAVGVAENLAGLLQDPRVTVYYDPADPSTNSMMEFGAKTAYDNKMANLSILAGVALLLAVTIAYAAGGSKPGNEAPVYSEQIPTATDKSDSES